MVMPRFKSFQFACAVAIALAGPAAQANGRGGESAVRDPADSKAAVPSVRYDSAFLRYRPNAWAEVGSWRDTNDNVGRIGGWRVYGREAIAEPEANPPPAAAGRNGGGDVKPEHGQPHRGPR